MGDLGELILFLIIAVLWGLGQLAQRRKRSQGDRPAPRPRAQRPQQRAPREEVTLEEWMERVRTGQVPNAPHRPQPESRPAPTTVEPDSPEAILREWQQRTRQPQTAERKVPHRAPPPVQRREPDAYATRQEQMRQAQEAEREQRRALAEERERERRELERRRAERRARRERARQREKERLGVAVPAAPLQEFEAEEPIDRHVRRSEQARLAYRRPSERPRHLHERVLQVTHDGLRQGILLAEILGPPVGLRPVETGSPFARISGTV